MADLLGTGINLPTVDITGFISSSWLYVFLIGFIGFAFIVILSLILFFTTYNKKIEIYENIAGRGFQKTMVTRARPISSGSGGVVVMKTLRGGEFLSAFGSRMGNNLYWFARGSDGYLYNVVLGDLDTKRAMLDIEPVDRDVRQFHVAMNKLIMSTYGEKRNLEKIVFGIFLLVLLIIFFVGMYINSGRLADTAKTNEVVATRLSEVSTSIKDEILAYENIRRATGGGEQSGLVPASS